MPAISTLQVVLEARTKPFEDSMKKAGGFVKGLKQSFGEQSGFGLLGKGLVGAGVIAGLTATVRAIDNITSAIRDANTELATGSISLDEWSLKLQKQIPVWGQVVSALENIADIMDGTSGAIAKNDATQAALQARLASRRELAAAQRAGTIQGDIQNRIEAINDAFWEAERKMAATLPRDGSSPETFNAITEAINNRRAIRDMMIGNLEREEAVQSRIAKLSREQAIANESWERTFAKFAPIADRVRNSLVVGSEVFKQNMQDAADAAEKGFLTASELLQFKLANDPVKNEIANQLKQLEQRAAAIKDSIMSPDERLRASADEIDRLFKNKLLTSSEAALAVSGLLSGSGSSSIDIAGAALRGSQESGALISGNRAAEIQVDLQRQQLVRMENMLGLSRDIVDELRKFNAAKVIE